jgi:hypothetical protein
LAYCQTKGECWKCNGQPVHGAELIRRLLIHINYNKRARCRHHSHVFRGMIWVRCACRVRSFFEIVRSERDCSCRFQPFPYRSCSRLANVPSVFVGGAPLIYALRHRHMSRIADVICHICHKQCYCDGRTFCDTLHTYIA